MAIRDNLQAVATRLVDQHGDPVTFFVTTTVPGPTQFDPPTYEETESVVMAVVTGSGQWADGVTILSTDLLVLVSGEPVESEVGAHVQIDGKTYTIIQKQKILAAGLASAIRYFVRHG